MLGALLSRRNLLHASALALGNTALAQLLDVALPELDGMLRLPDVRVLGGEVWTPKN